tara:strand:+ start:1205 stop:1555 length:351 start_codon:yes stop_codon:yes gene_type:complete
MTEAIKRLTFTRGETLLFAIRATPAYDGSEIVSCAIKPAKNGADAPRESTPAVATPSAAFIPASDYASSYWLFTLSAEQSADLAEGNYIADAKVTANGVVKYVKRLLIVVEGRVTV